MSCCAVCGTHGCACGCGARAGTPLPVYNRPGLDALAYRVGTWADFRATMQASLSDAALPALAGLRTREADDPAMAFLDAWAVGADVLTFYQERIATEGFLRTATERRSVLELARLVDYRLRPGVSASVYLAFTIDDNSAPVTIPAGARVQSVPAPGEQMQTFETSDPIEARHEWNVLQPRLTQPQNISLDTVAALDTLWVASAATNLKANDRLLFLFGDITKDGVPAIRLVQSVEAQPREGRSKVTLQTLGTTTAQLVAAANTALNALAGATDATAAEWQKALVDVRQQMLLGMQWNSYDRMTGSTELEGLPATLPAETAFVAAAKAAYGTPSAPPPVASGGFGALVDALTLSVTLQPANSLRLARDISAALGAASDTRPQLLLDFYPHLADTFYRAWTSVSFGTPSSTPLTGVYAMRLMAPLFGYNAPMTMIVTQTPASGGGGGSTSTVSTKELPSDELPDVVRLDNTHDGVLAGSYLVIQPPGSGVLPVIAQAQSTQVHPLTDYGISGKTTEIVLNDPSAASGQHLWQVNDMGTLRGTLVYAQSESLPLAELTITDSVGATTDGTPRATSDDATQLTLDGTLDGFKSGRWVIVAGRRTDVPGTGAVNAAELVMVSAVQQGADASIPGDTVHSKLVFANKGLAFAYARDSVSIYANVAHATNGETRNEVLGNGNGATAMQGFALKQKPLTFVSAPTVDGVQSTLVVRVNEVEWHETRNLAFVGPADRNFVTATANDGTTSVIFGDGTHGARLPTGVANVTAVYRNGIGMPGNVQAGQISLLATRPLGVKAVVNPQNASGGADPETRDQARANVPLAVLALDRLVSVQDYADFARTFGGVGKAAAIKLGNLVQVTIAGAADAPIDPTSDLFVNLSQALLRYGDPSLAVGLGVRELLTLTFSARVGLQPDYAWEAVEPQIRAALLDAFGFERRALAQSAWLGEIVACIQAVRGVAWVDVDAFGYLDKNTVMSGLGGGDRATIDGDETLAPASPGDLRGRVVPIALHAGPSPIGIWRPRVPALPARSDGAGGVLQAQLACFVPDVPDTLLLQEATP